MRKITILERFRRRRTALNAALHDAHALADGVLQNVADAIVTAGEDGAIGSFNRSARRLFGYTEAEVLGRPMKLIITTADPGDVDAEPVGRRRDGSCFPIEMDMSEVQVGERTVTIASIRDISERTARADEERRRAQALHREVQRDRAAFDEAPIGSVITSQVGQIERVNQAFCKMIGYAAGELIGTNFVALTHPDDRPESQRVVGIVAHNGDATHRFEKRYVHADGRIVDARVAATAIRDDEGEVAQIFAQIEDVTDARRTSRELQQAQVEMLARLAAVAEFRDDDTGRHTRRVGDLSVAIGERLGLPTAQLDLLRLAAPLHDVGKIAIPDAVLGKPGKLTTAEFDQMKTHTSVGAQMLAGSGFALLELSEQIALTHHEKWDGSGYPAGLAGDAIPIAGRIVAVADVFDALTHERPYKPAWSTADALAEMADQAGRHFDPTVLEAFLSLELAAVA
ncbi:MAG: hypothetical protein QOC68_301 [Solirubrobacteraceae bacterium]|nr:hypothetical protein [Solirubrobacteraceae bacterium]